MPATAKRGFRLPWMRDEAGSDSVATQVLDGRPADAPSPESDSATEPEAEVLDDLGNGPFGIAPPPRDLLAMNDMDPVSDLEPGAMTELDADAATPGEPGSETPGWLRHATPTGGGQMDEAGQPADVRPGSNVEPGSTTGPSSPPVAHESAPATAWPEADLAARAAVASSLAGTESSATPELGRADDPGAADQAATSTPAEPAPAVADPVSSAEPEPDHAGPTTSADSSVAREGVTAASKPAAQRTVPARAGASAPAAQPAHERRDNPLLTGLVRAMRDSARSTREETSARLRVEAEARVGAIRTRAAADAVGLRTQADDDVVGIREWSKAEMARIRLETTQRIEARRTQLATDSRALSAQTGRLVTEIEAAVATFETVMKRFFKALLAEEDPAQLATLAERMPEPPVLEELPEAVAVGIGNVSSGAKRRANHAAAKQMKGAKRANRSSTARSAGGARPGARPSRRAASGAGANQRGAAAGAATTLESGALDPETAALAEAEALAGLDLVAMTGGDWARSGVEPSSNGTIALEATDETTGETTVPDPPEEEFMIEGQTRLIVVGLGDTGVAAFEGALREVTGVGSVNVSPGDEGKVVFSVTHGTDTDLRAAVPELAGFRARVTADEGAILSIAATDP
ncbi:MAG TPA: hypothetical protein VEX41_05715 [Candidatus Eisenbacteria bacterium]|nr:hypothetical protein [Candidatus Eisenbacteria bacterium]